MYRHKSKRFSEMAKCLDYSIRLPRDSPSPSLCISFLRCNAILALPKPLGKVFACDKACDEVLISMAPHITSSINAGDHDNYRLPEA